MRLDPVWSLGRTGNSEEAGTGIHESRGLWAMHRDAGVMLEMADYAERSAEPSFDPRALAELRRDALRIRIHVVRILVRRFSPHWTH
jgi:hypothetical protein